MVGSIVSAPPLEAAVIVPLLVKELPDNVESAAAYRLVDFPLIDDAVACVAGDLSISAEPLSSMVTFDPKVRTVPAPVESYSSRKLELVGLLPRLIVALLNVCVLSK